MKTLAGVPSPPSVQTGGTQASALPACAALHLPDDGSSKVRAPHGINQQASSFLYQ